MIKATQSKAVETIYVIALLLIPGIATGQNAQNREAPNLAAEARPSSAPLVPNLDQKPAVSAQGISYSAGQLRIEVENSTLAEILNRVAAVTGVTIDVPEGANAEQIPSLKLGPGPAREILAALLSDSNFDYLIQGGDSEPDRVQAVLLLPRGKRDNVPDVPGRPGRSQYARAVVAPAPAPEETPAPEAPVTAQDQAVPAPQPDPAPPAASQPDLSAPPAYGQPLKTNVPATFPVAPPATFDQQSINQQLQQMYQQRSQMLQQERQAGSPAPPANR